MNILVLGATGLLGNAVFRVFSGAKEYRVFGTVRNFSDRDYFVSDLSDNLIIVEDLENSANLRNILDMVRPDVIINCISLGHLSQRDPKRIIGVLSVFPRILSCLCHQNNVRLIQMSSDGVFSGERGDYSENDLPDAKDPYGIAKLLGEVGCTNEITIRTSIIGHDSINKHGLLEWFLVQEECRLYTKAIFSGFPTTTLAQVILDEILPRPKLSGIYHLATRPISKYELLKLVAKIYKTSTKIIPDCSVVKNLSLNADKFKFATGYVPPEWPDLIESMYSYKFGLAGA